MFETSKHNLNEKEVNLIDKLLGNTYCCLCRGIGQLAICRSSFQGSSTYSTNGYLIYNRTIIEPLVNDVYDWKIILKVGVLIFSQNRESNEHYIQAIDMAKEKIVINHLVAQDTQFKRRRRFVLTFETRLGTFCLNFVDDDEADNFTNVLDRILQEKKTLSIA